jgi:hypothetical protein
MSTDAPRGLDVNVIFIISDPELEKYCVQFLFRRGMSYIFFTDGVLV